MNTHLAAIVGVGPGLGSALAHTFSEAGFALALMSRSTRHSATLADTLPHSLAIAADATDPASLNHGFELAQQHFGTAPSVMIYNAGIFGMGDVATTSADEFEQCWRLNCMGGFLAAKAVIAPMLAAHHGTLLFTGATASLRGGKGFSKLAVGKFGLRALSQSLARELGPQGIHVAHVILDGKINTPSARAQNPHDNADQRLSPAAIAETYLALHQQPPAAWTQEMDLRPSVEPF